MMKKRKNVQFIAAAALTAALVTSQFSFATVMGDDTATVQVSSLIPNNVTIDQPVPLSDISLPKSDYGTLSWADGSCVPSARVQTYDVVFRPYNAADLAKISGWDGQSEAIYSSVTVVVSSISKDSDYEGAQTEQEAADTENTTQNTEENTEAGTTDNTEENTETTVPEVTPEVTENPENTENTADSESTEDKNNADTDSTEVPETPDNDNTDNIITENTEAPAVTVTPSENRDTPEAVETPGPAVTPEADKDNIFDGTEKDITADDRAQSVEEDTEPSDEEKAQIAEKNHTCNGISVSGINLPWYVQFRAASGENYEFTNEAEANVFKSYDFELWDLKNNTEYEIPDGEYLSVTVPVKAGYDYTIEHLLDSGAMETIVPSVEGSTMVFSTHSFSPFGIAGSKALVGEEIEDGSYSSGTTSTATTTPQATAAASTNTGSTSGTTANNASNTASTSANNTSVQASTSENQNSTSDSADQSEADSKGNSVGAVETGDNTPILPFVIIGIAAAVIVAVLVYLKKKK
ncbi:hypothetical protein [Blautia obeum]|uniref:hypothetical protein n=1 Tax=Blautia obeum TaxID=40520 RepID=UPI00319DE84D